MHLYHLRRKQVKKCLESVKNVPVAKEETKRAKGLAWITRVEIGQQNKITLLSALWFRGWVRVLTSAIPSIHLGARIYVYCKV